MSSCRLIIRSVVFSSLDCTHFFKAALKKNLSPGYLKEDLVQLGLSEDKAAWIAGKVWLINLAANFETL